MQQIWDMDIREIHQIIARGKTPALDSGLLHGDDIPVDGLTVDSLNKSLFAEFFQNEFWEDISMQEISIASILENRIS